jgi:4-hydroxy-4-methyl-2-oxoglutarate aldolase
LLYTRRTVVKPTAGIVRHDRIRWEVTRPEPGLIDAYKALPDAAGLVARALDQIGIASTIPSATLELLKPGSLLVGPAVTVRNIPMREIPYRRWQRGDESVLGERDAFFVAQPGDAVVIDGAAAYPASCLGSMSVALAAQLGISGVVVGGAVTGVKGIKAASIPVWALGGTTITGHHRVETLEINTPIGLHGIRVEPGDLVVADDSGVTVVPLALAQVILERAQRMSRLGEPLKATIQAGADREMLRTALSQWWRDYARLGREG